MRSRFSLLGFAILFAVAASASAQYRGGTVELNGFAGYLVGGNIGHFRDFNNDCCHTDLDVDDHVAYGGRIGYNFNNLWEVEGEYTQSDTHLELDTHNNLPNQQIADLRFQYAMGYMTLNFGSSRFVPYFTLGSGAAILRTQFPGLPSNSEARYTASAGGGIKMFLNPHFAFRFDGRFYSTYLSDRAICGPDFCTGNTWVTNFVPSGGLVFAF